MNIIRTDLLSKIDFIDHGFFTRDGGESEEQFDSLNVGFERGDDDTNVIKNRTIIAENFGIDVSKLIILHQMHGKDIHVIDESNLNKYEFKDPKQAMSIEGDAIITNQKGVLIGVNTADCAPILLVDPVAKFIGVIHAGWKGALGGVIEATFEKMKSLGCKNIYSSIGPCIQRRSFEVGNEITDEVDRKYITVQNERLFFDMQFYILEKLLKLGSKTVSKINMDTFTNSEFFSYRRQNGNCGVQFSGIIIKE